MVSLPSTAWTRLSIVTGALLVMAELDRLLSACLGPQSVPASASALFGPLGLLNRNAWDVWRTTAYTDVAALVALLQVHRGVPDVLRWILSLLTELKWVAVLALVIALLRSGAVRLRLRTGARRWLYASFVQRLSLVVVLVLGVLALNPGPDVADQMPDVVRRWTDLSGDDARHLTLAVLLTAVTAVGLFVLGRLRTERVWTAIVGREARKERAPSIVWLSWPAMALGAAIALRVTGKQTSFDWRFWLAVLVPVAVYAISLAVRNRWGPITAVSLPQHDEVWAGTAWRVGDALAAAVVVLLGLALLRAFTAPAVLGAPATTDLLAGEQGSLQLAQSRQTLQVIAVFAGIVLTALAPPLLRAAVRRLDARLATTAAESADRSRWSALWPATPSGAALTPWAWTAWAGAVAVLVLVALWPLRSSAVLGVFAVTELALLAWAVVIGLDLVHLQHSEPAEVFRLLHLRYHPVLTLALAVPFIASLSGGDPTVHALRASTAGGSATEQTQPKLADLTQSWVDLGSSCSFPLEPAAGQGSDGGAVQVQPLLLLAADGGGIRASRWTVEAVQHVRQAWQQGTPTCPHSPLLLASGVSGGSVGLALSRGNDAETAEATLEAPDALAGAAVGLLVRDLLAGGAGLKVPALDAGGAWTDRAGLMEVVWERASAALKQPFTFDTGGPGPALVFNSAAAGTGCRVLVEQVDVRTGAPPPSPTAQNPGPDCRGRSDLPAGSLDLWESYGGCLQKISWATAAMLSARFSTVTPAGRVRACNDAERDLQLIDGGYGEGSGLGTIDEVLPTVLDVVRRANAATGSPRRIVVPVVVFLQNRSGADVSTPVPDLSAELLVPLAGQAAKGVQSSTGSWLQRASAQLQHACAPSDAACSAALTRVWATMPGGIVVVAPAEQPTVEPPLGWTLSAASRIRLMTAMDHETTVCRDPTTTGILGGYGRFGALLNWLQAHTPCTGATRPA